MGAGYVLDYTDATFAVFFHRHQIDIHGTRYQTYGTSKARKLRAFWDREPDAFVGEVLTDMLDMYEVKRDLDSQPVDAKLLGKARQIVGRLLGMRTESAPTSTETDFLRLEFSFPSVDQLPIEATIAPILQSRLDEAHKAMGAKAHLSVVIMCGSVLEAVLLGAAQKDPKRFNTANATPKGKNRAPKQFREWRLAEFIDVASEIGLLKPDVQKFSHGLRDFRNYIHPYQQVLSGFTPDQHTATVCLQVLKAALASVAGTRP